MPLSLHWAVVPQVVHFHLVVVPAALLGTVPVVAHRGYIDLDHRDCCTVVVVIHSDHLGEVVGMLQVVPIVAGAAAAMVVVVLVAAILVLLVDLAVEVVAAAAMVVVVLVVAVAVVVEPVEEDGFVPPVVAVVVDPKLIALGVPVWVVDPMH